MNVLKQPFSVQMRRYEIIGGILWFLVYHLFIGLVLEVAFELLGLGYDMVLLNGVYFFLSFGITVILFRRFLAYSLPEVAERPLRFFKGLLVGFCAYWVLSFCLTTAVELMGFSPWVPNDDTVAEIAGGNFRLMWVGAVLLAPITEETLVRGLIFGNLRKKNRVVAYIVTAVVFALMHILPYVIQMGYPDLGYNLLVYGLPSVALCLCYEWSGSIWGPIVLHMFINFMGMGAY